MAGRASRGTSCLRRSVAVGARKEWQEKVPSGRPAALRRRLTMRRRSLPVIGRWVSPGCVSSRSGRGGPCRTGRPGLRPRCRLSSAPGGRRGRHLVDLAAFLPEMKPPLVAVRIVVADLELGDGAGAGAV